MNRLPIHSHKPQPRDRMVRDAHVRSGSDARDEEKKKRGQKIANAEPTTRHE